MGQYIKLECKRLFYTLPGFLLSLFSVLLLSLFMVLLAGRLLPEVLEVKPFQIGLCVEGSDIMSNYVREYVQQMESTENLMEFCEMQSLEIEEAVKRGELTAGIIIPEKTATSVMDGTNIPIRVLLGKGTDTTERYLQTKLLSALTECGAAMIDVPQAETLFLYEMQVKNPEELGVTLDLFHFGLVIDREKWFEKETISAFGSADMKTYYLAAGLTLLFLLWGLGSGSFFREQEKNLPLLLERQGIPLFYQQGVKQILFFILYLIPALILVCGWAGWNNGGVAVAVIFCAAMLAMQSGFIFQLAPTTGSGIILNGVWGLIGFFGAGGILPGIFLPEKITEICAVFPAGICMNLFQWMINRRRGDGWQTMKYSILWCLFFGISSQFLFYKRQWSKKKK